MIANKSLYSKYFKLQDNTLACCPATWSMTGISVQGYFTYHFEPGQSPTSSTTPVSKPAVPMTIVARSSSNMATFSARCFSFIGWWQTEVKVYCIAVFDHKRVSLL
ncbi:hypothetical protein Dda3937_04518 [Dickeya dadantii 3937]|uniref:Uncharacterized protein n=1 Tax=Dickeya dadantii (strain 3937) TaxID=198628 RepID=E0SHI2_DICD3|nr:hypothetical protein Dda3937_04518 [Dickeya dadantii 3937]